MSGGTTQKVAVLGLGIIGSRATARMAAAGWRVVSWNRTPKGLPGEATTPEQAVDGVSLVSIYLKDAPAVREVVERIAHLLGPGQTVLNHATVDLETTHWLACLCSKKGCRFLDAPFTGSRLAAENGQLVYYTGGDPDLAAELDGFLAATSKERLHCGGVGAATVVKLATNLISACTVQAMAEALAISTRNGVSADCLAQAVSRNASGSPLTAMKFPAMLGADFEPHFSLENMAKDSRYMLALARAAGVDTPEIAAVSRRMAELCEAGLGDMDYSVLAKPYLEIP